LTGEDALSAWAPEDAPWSPWVKPVLFAHIDRTPLESVAFRETALPEGWHAGLVAPGTALIIELPGEAAVWAGLAAAEVGFRPIPLFNALPGPPGERSFVPFGLGALPISAVDVRPTIAALAVAAPRLRGGSRHRSTLALDAPPAFLVDSRRLDGRGRLVPGRFDNRSAHSLSDFPSAQRLRTGGVDQMVVVLDAARPGWDLVPTLEHYRRGGITVAQKRFDGTVAPWPGRGGAWLLGIATWVRRLTLSGNGRRGFGGWTTAAGG
jgi:hypothetical protein